MTPPKQPAHYDSDLPPEPLSEDTPPEPAELARPPEPDDLAAVQEPAPAPSAAPAHPAAVPAPPAPPNLASAPAPVGANAVAQAPARPFPPSPIAVPPAKKPDALERQRMALAAEIHNPRGASRKAVLVPAAVLLLLLGGGSLLVHIWAGAEDVSRHTVQEVKTPHQERLEQERALQELMPNSAPPELAELPPEPSPAGDAQAAAQPPADAAPAARAPQRRARPAPSVTQPPAGEAPPPPEAPAPSPRRSLATSMATSFSDASPASASSATVPRGTLLPACLTAVADPSQSAPFTATVSADVKAGDSIAVPRNSTLVCTPQGLTASRLTGGCDTLTIPGRGSVSFAGLLYGKDKRPGLPVVLTGGTGAGEEVKDTALAIAERVLGAVSPGGIGGELLQGAAGAGGRVARSSTRSPEASARPVPKGTCFLVFVDQPF